MQLPPREQVRPLRHVYEQVCPPVLAEGDMSANEFAREPELLPSGWGPAADF